MLEAGWLLVRGALALDADAFRALHATVHEQLLALAVLFAAALSQAIGQSAVLFVHRVSPKRFLFSLIVTAILFMFTVVLWAAVFWIVCLALFGKNLSFPLLLAGVSLGHAPYLFGFLILVPAAGLVIRSFLQVWSLLAVIASLLVLPITFPQVVGAALVGWTVAEIIQRAASSPFRLLNGFFKQVIYSGNEEFQMESLRELLLRRTAKGGGA